MLDLSGLLVTWPAPIIVGIVFTSIMHVDRFNDRTTRPIPVARAMWEPPSSPASEDKRLSPTLFGCQVRFAASPALTSGLRAATATPR
jgi:hypothetical protein